MDSHYVPSDSPDNTSEDEDVEENAHVDEEILGNIDNDNSNNAVEIENQGAVVVKGRKRKRNEKNWKCNVRKEKRAAGQEYVSKKKKVVQEKKLKQKCKETCKLKCSLNFTEENRADIFKHFWSASMDNNQKRQFVALCITRDEVQRRRERTGQKRRNTTLHYHFLKDHKRVRVCKTFFQNTLSISQTFVETSLSKRLPNGGTVLEDLRGKHTPKNKISEDIRNKIREHILKFPVQESHYRREKSSKKYLESNLSIKKMYELYVLDCREQNVPLEQIAKLWLYADIFNSEFNYSFKNPVNDTCDECDHFQVKLRNMLSNEEKQQIQDQYDKHLDEASKRYKLKKADKEQSFQNSSLKVVMVDLEKCLPTPVLTNAQSFYSLKLWTFNYTIHDATDKDTYCCLWDESIAGRGVNEMASCLVRWIESLNISPDLKKIIIWSDNCPSQNRNIGMVMCYFYILNKFPQLEEIEHKYLLRGHTHLEADSDHSLVERYWRKESQFKIMIPWDWHQLVRACNKKKPFTVLSMETEHFRNLKRLYEERNAPYLFRKKSVDGSPFLISNAVCLQVRSNSPGFLYYKTDFDEECRTVDLNRNRRNIVASKDIPVLSQIAAKPITTKKYNHLQNLLKWVPQVFHPFYKNLQHSDSVREQDIDD